MANPPQSERGKTNVPLKAPITPGKSEPNKSSGLPGGIVSIPQIKGGGRSSPSLPTQTPTNQSSVSPSGQVIVPFNNPKTNSLIYQRQQLEQKNLNTQFVPVASKFDAPTGFLERIRYDLNRKANLEQTNRLRRNVGSNVGSNIKESGFVIGSEIVAHEIGLKNLGKKVFEKISTPPEDQSKLTGKQAYELAKKSLANFKQDAEDLGESIGQDPTRALSSVGTKLILNYAEGEIIGAGLSASANAIEKAAGRPIYSTVYGGKEISKVEENGLKESITDSDAITVRNGLYADKTFISTIRSNVITGSELNGKTPFKGTSTVATKQYVSDTKLLDAIKNTNPFKVIKADKIEPSVSTYKGFSVNIPDKESGFVFRGSAKNYNPKTKPTLSGFVGVGVDAKDTVGAFSVSFDVKNNKFINSGRGASIGAIKKLPDINNIEAPPGFTRLKYGGEKTKAIVEAQDNLIKANIEKIVGAEKNNPISYGSRVAPTFLNSKTPTTTQTTSQTPQVLKSKDTQFQVVQYKEPMVTPTTNAVSFVKPTERTRTFETVRLRTDTTTAQAQIPRTFTNTITKPNLRTLQQSQFRQGTLQKQKEQLVFGRPDITRTPTPRPRFRIETPGFPGFKNRGSVSGHEPRYNVKVRRRGQFDIIGADVSLKDAVSLGSINTKRTLSRTFKIEPLTRGSMPDISLNSGMFRRPKTNSRLNMPLTFVERGRFALDTPSEISQLARSKRR